MPSQAITFKIDEDTLEKGRFRLSHSQNGYQFWSVGVTFGSVEAATRVAECIQHELNHEEGSR
jgi:hypothetical protein